ncbi:hypothetical protein Taro_038342 [Colocasia esculenta]|uniref:Uncharacterized protein n=1 Tax=Colocasia esculenta TaxID=4460 RepID=A0A843WSG2_COLES|nr:hypothetical protein [Colocasia esculenta]
MNRQPGRDASTRRVHNASDPGVATSEIAAYRAVATSGETRDKCLLCLRPVKISLENSLKEIFPLLQSTIAPYMDSQSAPRMTS